MVLRLRMTCLKNDKNQRVSKTDDILSETVNFYKRLYKSQTS